MPTSTPAFLGWLATQSAALSTQGLIAEKTAIVLVTTHLTIFEVLGILATIGLVIGTAVIMARLKWIQSRVDRWRHVILNADMAREQTKRTWKDVERHFFVGDENDLKIAIIEADKALDNALRNAGVTGATLGDRLKRVKPSQLPNIDAVWQAHKLRNQIAHDAEMSLKRDAAEKALSIYRTALETLGALDEKK